MCVICTLMFIHRCGPFPQLWRGPELSSDSKTDMGSLPTYSTPTPAIHIPTVTDTNYEPLLWPVSSIILFLEVISIKVQPGKQKPVCRFQWREFNEVNFSRSTMRAEKPARDNELICWLHTYHRKSLNHRLETKRTSSVTRALGTASPTPSREPTGLSGGGDATEKAWSATVLADLKVVALLGWRVSSFWYHTEQENGKGWLWAHVNQGR